MRHLKLNSSKKVALLRIVFGVVWTVDAAFKFQPAFYKGLLVFIKAKDAGEPSWLSPWFHTWYHIIGWSPRFFAYLIILLEVLIAISLLFGLARKLVYIFGAAFSFVIWGVGEAFGGPYVSGVTDINAGFIYVIVFLCLYVMDGLVEPSWSLDPRMKKLWQFWPKFANPSKLK